MSRELTRQEKAAIRSLVKRWCANYDKDIGCLPLDCECYMLGKCWTGAYCRYFRSAVLPLDPVLERSLTVETVAETRPCPVCGSTHHPAKAHLPRTAPTEVQVNQAKQAAVQEKTSLLPDYNFAGSDSAAGTSVSGLVGCALVAALAAIISLAGRAARKKSGKKQASAG